MDPGTIVAGMQKWRWLAAVLAPLLLLVCCIATRAPDARPAIEQAFRALSETQALFGEVYTMSSTLKPSHVGWTGGVKSGCFVCDVRGHSLRTDVMIHWVKPAGDAPVAITKVSTAGGRLIYAPEEAPGRQAWAPPVKLRPPTRIPEFPAKTIQT